MKIAFASTNRNKFSETFIRSQLELLEDEDILLSDGYLPTSLSLDKGQNYVDIPPVQTGVLGQKSDNASERLMDLLKQQNIEKIFTQFGPAGVEILPVCQALGLPLIVYFHGYDAFRDDVLNSYGKTYPLLFAYAERIVAVSDNMAHQLQALGCPEAKIKTLACGVDAEFFKPLASNSGKQGPPKLVFCGRFVAKKAPMKVLEVFADVRKEMPEVELTMIGDGELLASCKAWAAENLPANSVVFTGILAPDQVLKQLQGASAFLQHSMLTPTNDSEGTPVSVMEAMAVALPVIATRHGGIPEVIDHGQTGMLCEPGDKEGMVAHVLEVLRNPEVGVSLGKAARAHILQHHEKGPWLKELRELLGKTAR